MIRRSGVTLLEVIVAMALASVLMGAVWTLFQILSKRQIIEVERAESRQLLRSLHQRVTRDLNNLPALGFRTGTKTTPVFEPSQSMTLPWPYNSLTELQPDRNDLTVFRGDRYSLTLGQFVEPIDWLDEQNMNAHGRHEADLGRDKPIRENALLKQIEYHLPTWPQKKSDEFQAEEFTSFDDFDRLRETHAPGGLTREERLPWPLPKSADANAWDDKRQPPNLPFANTNESNLESMESSPVDDETDSNHVDPPNTESVPEVVAAIWAYFDGQRWRSKWDSDLEQRLPVAVRLRWRHRPIANAETAEGKHGFAEEMAPVEFASEGDEQADDALEIDSEQDVNNSTMEPWYDCEWIFLIQPRFFEPEGNSPTLERHLPSLQRGDTFE